MNTIVKICRYHGELTQDQTYFKKLESGNYSYTCKKCHAMGFERRRQKSIKLLSESNDTDIIITCFKHGDLTRDKLTRTTKKCRQCNTDKHIKWQKNNPERVKEYQRRIKNHPDYSLRNRKCVIKKKYGITLDQYNELLKKQNYVCAICKQRETTIEAMSQKLKPLCIDHCHKTGKIRGLLCNRCNPMIGLSLDDIKRLQAAIDYLLRHK